MNGFRKIAFACSVCLGFTGAVTSLPAVSAYAAEWETVTDEAGLVRYCTSGKEAYADGLENPDYSGAVSILPEINGLPVTSIAPDAFNGAAITAVTIPDSVTVISAYAFAGTSLTEVTIPDSVTRIEAGAFGSCGNLTAVTLPAGLLDAESAFSGCTALTDITMPDSALHAIDPSTFEYTKWLTDRQAENPIVVYKNRVIDGTAAEGDVVIPDGVTSIGRRAFQGCRKMTSVQIPDSVTGIGAEAFLNCSNLEDLVLPKNLTEIGERAFQECHKITEIRIPGSVRKISDYAFLSCIRLAEAEIEEGVAEIGQCVFGSCIKLADIRIPHSVTHIGYDAFRDTPWLEERQKVSDVNCANQILFNGKNAKGTVTVAPGILCIAEGAFESNDQLVGIILPDTLERIERNAFKSCLYLTEVTIPASVKSIGEFAFCNCNLEEIRILNPACQIDRTQDGQTICTRVNQPYSEHPRCVFYGTVYGYDDSTAEAYAADNNYKFVSLGEAPVFQGDLTGDYEVGIEDAQTALKAYTEKVAGKPAALTEKQRKAADVNSDGELTVEDAQLILIYYTENGVAGKLILWEQILRYADKRAVPAAVLTSGS